MVFRDVRVDEKQEEQEEEEVIHKELVQGIGRKWMTSSILAAIHVEIELGPNSKDYDESRFATYP